MVVEAPQNHQQAKANVSATFGHVFGSVQISCPLFEALVRDGFRCIVTGLYDATSVEHNKELDLEMERAAGHSLVTQCAHIFPESVNKNISGSNAQGDKVCLFPS